MITVGIVDDEAMIRDSFGAWFANHASDITVTSAAGGVAALMTAVLMTAAPPPQVVLLDALLRDGTRLAENLRQLRNWPTNVVIVTTDISTPGMRRVALRCGASGFLHKSDSMEDLRRAIRAAAAGEIHINRSWARMLYDNPEVELTAQQERVMEFFAGGMTTVEVACRMRIGPETVRTYLRQIRERYERAGRPANTRRELEGRAREDGLLGDW